MAAAYNPAHISILLGQMILSPAILESTRSAGIDGSHLTNNHIGGTVPQAILFDIIRSYHGEHGIAPDDATLHAEIDSYLARFFQTETKRNVVRREVAHFFEFKKEIDERSIGGARKMIQKIAEICVIQPAARDLLNEPARTGDIAGLRDNLDQLQAKQASIAGGLSRNGLVDMPAPETGERVSTGIPWLDSRLGDGRGPVNGSTIGIIAPQNAGKTSLGIQLAVAQALMGRHALLVLAEEGMSRSMRNKILGCALGVDYTLFETKGIPEVIADTKINKKVAAKKLANIEVYFHYLDMVEHNLVSEGFAPIQGEIAQLSSQSKKPVYVYIDWAGIIADATCQITKRTKQQELQTLSYAIAGEAHRSNIIIAMSQQMGTLEVKKGPFMVHDMYCAADCKMWCAPFKYALAINKQDPKTGYSLLTFVKARDDGVRGETSVMELRGELASFFDVSDRYEIRSKKFVSRKAKNDHKTPMERKRR